MNFLFFELGEGLAGLVEGILESVHDEGGVVDGVGVRVVWVMFGEFLLEDALTIDCLMFG